MWRRDRIACGLISPLWPWELSGALVPRPCQAHRDHPSTGPNPGYRDETGSIFPSLLNPLWFRPCHLFHFGGGGARSYLSLQRGGLWSFTGEAECGQQALSPQLPLCLPAPQVYSATNVELVTRTRTEHLSDQDKSKSKGKPRCACLLSSHTICWGHPGLGSGLSWEAFPIPTCSVSHPIRDSQGGWWWGPSWSSGPKSPNELPPFLLRRENSIPVLPRDGPAALLPQRGEPRPGWGAMGRGLPGRAWQAPS